MADLTAGYLLASGVLAAIVRAPRREGIARRGVAARRCTRGSDPGPRSGSRTRERSRTADRDRKDLAARADEIAGDLAMNPYYRCYAATDGFLAVACLNHVQRDSFLALIGLDDETIEGGRRAVAPGRPCRQAAGDRRDRDADRDGGGVGVARATGRGGIPAGPALVRESVPPTHRFARRSSSQTSSSPGSAASGCWGRSSVTPIPLLRPRSAPTPRPCCGSSREVHV